MDILRVSVAPPKAGRAPLAEKFAYNAQAVVDAKAGIIVGAEVVQDESDNFELVDMIDGVKEAVLSPLSMVKSFSCGLSTVGCGLSEVMRWW